MGLLSRKVVLASGSPYRAQILRDVGLEFAVIVSDVDESLHPKGEPVGYARALAVSKAQAVAKKVGVGKLVIAADTICAIDQDIIGKPEDEEDARRMIARSCETGLQRVITGVCVTDTSTGEEFTLDETSLVEMAPASEDQIAEYVASRSSMGKYGTRLIASDPRFARMW
ncbi:MAG: Maf-like protein [Planctomycetes bacterium]|nr:Maf-like protein [Planctomycetota bacterium]